MTRPLLTQTNGSHDGTPEGNRAIMTTLPGVQPTANRSIASPSREAQNQLICMRPPRGRRSRQSNRFGVRLARTVQRCTTVGDRR